MRNLKVVEGERDDDLVTTIIRAIDMARSCRSGTTVHLLKMALLNEGMLLADDLSRGQSSGADQQACPLNLVGTERPTGRSLPASTLRSARPKAARPRPSPVADRAVRFLASVPTRE